MQVAKEFDVTHKVKKSELERGIVYLTNDGRLLMYLGEDSGYLLFYLVCGVVLIDTKNYNRVKIYNLEHAQSLFYNFVHSNIKILNREGMLAYKTVPRLIGSLDNVSYSNKVDYIVQQLYGKPINGKKSEGFTVKAKDLIVGHYYVSAGAEISTNMDVYRYDGRDCEGYYVWSYLGRLYHYYEGRLNTIYSSQYHTKNMKKVYPLEYALNVLEG